MLVFHVETLGGNVFRTNFYGTTFMCLNTVSRVLLTTLLFPLLFFWLSTVLVFQT